MGLDCDALDTVWHDLGGFASRAFRPPLSVLPCTSRGPKLFPCCLLSWMNACSACTRSVPRCFWFYLLPSHLPRGGPGNTHRERERAHAANKHTERRALPVFLSLPLLSSVLRKQTHGHPGQPGIPPTEYNVLNCCRNCLLMRLPSQPRYLPTYSTYGVALETLQEYLPYAHTG